MNKQSVSRFLTSSLDVGRQTLVGLIHKLPLLILTKSSKSKSSSCSFGCRKNKTINYTAKQFTVMSNLNTHIGNEKNLLNSGKFGL